MEKFNSEYIRTPVHYYLEHVFRSFETRIWVSQI